MEALGGNGSGSATSCCRQRWPLARASQTLPRTGQSHLRPLVEAGAGKTSGIAFQGGSLFSQWFWRLALAGGAGTYALCLRPAISANR